ncbi:flagellar basal body-associated FliL family protein [Desulfovibrio oxamicus]|uniref:Flagellar protein FliL n=1 Tax=Nitratidesulfovibrio oxamicus TaxID=32016 RepID=A0ABS0J2Z9_9BACT|nr:flagellar basal body-associated FliL family protein [Nitratidesulfovibrio oxamicus]MBG3876812.1 flagellar basal body-associated FliL family protein [Nitratidesulfovibrio oxamicus]
MAEEAAPPKKKSGKLKWIILILLLLLLGGGGGGGAYWWFVMRPAAQNAEGAPESANAEGKADAKGGEAPARNAKVAKLPTFLVNLADPTGRRYLKLTMEVEVGSDATVKELEGQSAKVRDAVILLLSSKSYADLAPIESKLQLKNEVAERLNQILGGPKVLRVYITEMVIQ